MLPGFSPSSSSSALPTSPEITHFQYDYQHSHVGTPTENTPTSPEITHFQYDYQQSQVGTTTENTPRSSAQPSPTTINLSREYTLAFQTNSFNEMWLKIHVADPNDYHDQERKQDPEQMLQPNRECVQDALLYTKPETLTSLMSSYFDHSESAFHLCSRLLQSVHSARALYAPLHDVLDSLPLDANSLTLVQCSWAFDVFHQFDCIENPFHCPESCNFNELQCCFSQLKKQVDISLSKSRSRIRLIGCATTGSAICLIGTAVGVVISAVAITTHALVAIVASPFLTRCHSRMFARKELALEAQLDAASKGNCVLTNGLGTIDRLVAWLETAVENDKLLIRFGLERGMDKHTLHEVVKKVRKDRARFIHHLKDLEKHICRFFATVNWARSLLLQEIHIHQNCNGA